MNFYIGEIIITWLKLKFGSSTTTENDYNKKSAIANAFYANY